LGACAGVWLRGKRLLQPALTVSDHALHSHSGPQCASVKLRCLWLVRSASAATHDTHFDRSKTCCCWMRAGCPLGSHTFLPPTSQCAGVMFAFACGWFAQHQLAHVTLTLTVQTCAAVVCVLAVCRTAHLPSPNFPVCKCHVLHLLVIGSLSISWHT
jgi:hypothetical protein